MIEINDDTRNSNNNLTSNNDLTPLLKSSLEESRRNDFVFALENKIENLVNNTLKQVFVEAEYDEAFKLDCDNFSIDDINERNSFIQPNDNVKKRNDDAGIDEYAPNNYDLETHYTSDNKTGPNSQTKQQEETFIRWANHSLKKWDIRAEPRLGSKLEVVDLSEDFKDGLRLIILVQVLTNKKGALKFNKNPVLRTQKLENVSIALSYLRIEQNVKIVNIDSSDIVDGSSKLILGLIWTLITHFNLTKSAWARRGEEGPTGKDQSASGGRKLLLKWLNERLAPFNASANNFTTDWTDGVLLKLLIDGIIPDLYDLTMETDQERVSKCLQLAEGHLEIAPLIDANDITMGVSDEKSMMTYLSQFPNSKSRPFLVQKLKDDSLPTYVGSRLYFRVYLLRTTSDDVGDCAVDATITGPDSPAAIPVVFESAAIRGVQDFSVKFDRAGVHILRAYVSGEEARGSPMEVPVEDDFDLNQIRVARLEGDCADADRVAYRVSIGSGSPALLS